MVSVSQNAAIDCADAYEPARFVPRRRRQARFFREA